MAAEEITTRTIEVDSVIEVRNLAKRELDVRLVPWGRVIETTNGLEMFERGAFADAVPSQVLLMGLEHEAHMGLGQSGEPIMTRHPVGKATELDDREDAQYATFKVAKTNRGDEVLALAEEGIASGVSVEFGLVPGGTETRTQRGRRLSVHKRARLTGASTTYRPAYEEAVVLEVRSERSTPVPEATPVTEPQAPPDYSAMAAAIGSAVGDRVDSAISVVQARSAIPEELMEKFMARLEALEEQGRANFSVPSKTPEGEHFSRGDWAHLVLRMLSGETVRHEEVQARLAADLITTDNLGVVPNVILNEMIGTIDRSRPFLQSTRQLTPPRNGRTFEIPRIVTRPTVGVQAVEKDELTSTATSIDTVSFTPITIGGYGDISIQLLKMSDPSYLDLYIDLLAEKYAIMADDKAVDALLAETDVVEGGAVDPNDGPQFGAAWASAIAVSNQLAPDTIWLSSSAVAAFIDAHSDTTNLPLYANIAGNFTAAGGPGGTISGLRPVHVPALNDEAVDIIVGPSRGFAWSEMGTFTLQVDVPSKAGRDVALVGMVWPMPIYPSAFTTFTLSS